MLLRCVEKCEVDCVFFLETTKMTEELGGNFGRIMC